MASDNAPGGEHHGNVAHDARRKGAPGLARGSQERIGNQTHGGFEIDELYLARPSEPSRKAGPCSRWRQCAFAEQIGVRGVAWTFSGLLAVSSPAPDRVPVARGEGSCDAIRSLIC